MMNVDQRKEYMKKWYPIIARLRVEADIHVKAFDPGVRGKVNGNFIYLDSAGIELVLGLLDRDETPRYSDRAVVSKYKRIIKEDAKFWEKFSTLEEDTKLLMRDLIRQECMSPQTLLETESAKKLVRLKFLTRLQKGSNIFFIPAPIYERMINA